jgi:PiT family inorganic phosphate transporter
VFWAAFFNFVAFPGVRAQRRHAIGAATVEPCAIVGAARRACAVRSNVASSIVYAWALAIPAAAVVALAS